MGELLNLSENPLFVKHLRSRFRRSSVSSSLIVTIFLSLCLVAGDLIPRYGLLGNPAQPDFGPGMFFTLMVLQWVILYVLGGSQVAASVAYVKDSGILDYHRITPLPARVQAVGFILGAPIREHMMFAATAPIGILLGLLGGLTIAEFCKCYLVLFGSSLMCHTLAFLVGLSAKSSRGASGRYVLLLFCMNLGALFISSLSQKTNSSYLGPGLVSILPVVSEVHEDVDERMMIARWGNNRPAQVQWVPPQPVQKGVANKGKGQPQPPQPQFVFQPPAKQARQPILFFGMAFPLVFQTLFVQALVVYFVFIGAERRLKSTRLTLYSKPQTVAFFGAITLFAIGTLWQMTLEWLVIVHIYLMTLFALGLIGMCTQNSGELRKGYQRAVRHGLTAPPPWSELASNQLSVLCLSGIMTVFAGVHYFLLNLVQAPNAIGYLTTFAVAIGAIFAGGFLMQHCALRFRTPWLRFSLYIFFLWFAPIVLLILNIVLQKPELNYLLALTPLTSIPFTSIVDNLRVLQIDPDIFRLLAVATLAVQSGLFLILSLNSERALRHEVVAESNEEETPVFINRVEEGIEP